MSSRFHIDALGAQGDGIARTDKGSVFVPFTLPGEEVTASRQKDRAELIAVLEASELRVEPKCRHFTVCGGCALQHMEPQAYLDWKRAKIGDSLKSRNIDVPVADIVPCDPGSRRRAIFSARRTEAGGVLGYNRAFSHEIVDIAECPILVPEIANQLPMLRELARLVGKSRQPFHLTVTHTETGLDVSATESGALDAADRAALTDFIMRSGIARLSVDSEIILEPRKPIVDFGGTTVTLAPGSFLQAVKAAETAMAELVAVHLGKAKKVADLFAGSGTFALRLARNSEVHAVEGDAVALAALDGGFRMGRGLKRLTIEKRDLFRRPMMFKELNAYDGLVFDPPRAGAEDQCKHIAKSDVQKVAAVSCNPVSLSRDLAILIEGGYQLKSVTPMDQFLWSPHVEAVALLEKPKRRR
ncbi:MAG: class I SAM-dependent RNA methyltransferase [Rhizobiaceae bacterium]|nr:class I SAM-dependent RNA methyltransferase [Rhizobiaceae bacterium]